GSLLEGIFGNGCQEFTDLLLNGDEKPNVVRIPPQIAHLRLGWSLLVGISPEVHDKRPVRHDPRAACDIPFNRGEEHLPVVPTNRIERALLGKIEDRVARAFGDLALEVREKIVAVEMDPEGLVAKLVALGKLFLDLGVSRCSQ